MDTEIPRVHNTNLPTTRGNPYTRNTSSDLPPSYHSIFASTNTNAADRTCEDEAQLLGNDDIKDFKDKTSRIGFIQKVLALKLLQLLGMTAVLTIFWANSWDLFRFMSSGNNSTPLIVTPILVSTVIFGLMVFCERFRYTFPFQYMFLVAYPLSLTVWISIWVIYWNYLTPILLTFVYYCVVIFILLIYSVFASQSKLEFDSTHCVLLAIGAHMVIFVGTICFLRMNETNILCASYVSCFIMAVEYIYVICDIQAMTSTNYWIEITPADFVGGVINLHIDYYNIIYNLVAPKTSYDSRTIRNQDLEI